MLCKIEYINIQVIMLINGNNNELSIMLINGNNKKLSIINGNNKKLSTMKLTNKKGFRVHISMLIVSIGGNNKI